MKSEEEFTYWWKRFSGTLMRRKRLARIMKRRKAIMCLTRFFLGILHRKQVAALSPTTVQFNWDPVPFVSPMVQDACRKVQTLARKWLIRKSGRFATAYADEIFDTAFTHLAGKIHMRVPNGG
jgi:hypothetical protein